MQHKLKTGLLVVLRLAFLAANLPIPVALHGEPPASAPHPNYCIGDRMSPTEAASAEALRSLLQQQEAAWNRNDAAAWAAPFAENADFITLRGDTLHGRAAIEASHRMIFTSFYKGSHDHTTVERLHLLSSDVALVDVLHEVTNLGTLPSTVNPTEPGVLRARMRFVAVRGGSGWSFVAAQNTAVASTPPASPAPTPGVLPVAV